MKKKIAAVSMCRNDSFFLERWISYYGKILGYKNLYLFIDGIDQKLPLRAEQINCFQISHIKLNRLKADRFRAKRISEFAKELHKKYDVVLATDIDEFLVLDPNTGLKLNEYLSKNFISSSLSALGIDVAQHPTFEKSIDKKKYVKKIDDLLSLSNSAKKTLTTDDKMQTLGKDFANSKGSMFLGRGYSYPIALEGALKLKELAYVHAEGYPAGEMKHGPLALIEEGMPVVVIAPRDEHYKKTISNMQEVISRGAKVLLITNKSTDEVYSENIWEQIEVDHISDELIPFLTTIPLQKLAYYSALDMGYDIDKPRNLAKSVTVE